MQATEPAQVKSMRTRKPIAASLGLLVTALLVAACQKLDPVDTGGIAARLAFPPLSAAEAGRFAMAADSGRRAIAAVRPDTTSLGACGLDIANYQTIVLDFAISGSDFPTITAHNAAGGGLVTSPGVAEVVADITVTDIPAGSGRTVASHLTAAAVVVCSGSVTGVTISAGATTDVGTIDMKPVSGAPIYTVGGTVTGLAGTVVLNNGNDFLSLSADGAFAFPTRLKDGAGYSVKVGTQPTTQTCTVSQASGTVNGANASNVTVACVDRSETFSGTFGGSANFTATTTSTCVPSWKFSLSGTLQIVEKAQSTGFYTGTFTISGTNDFTALNSCNQNAGSTTGAITSDISGALPKFSASTAVGASWLGYIPVTFTGTLSGTHITGTMVATYASGTGSLSMPVVLTRQ
jgi:hypothetical protein